MLDGNSAALRQYQALTDAADRIPLDMKRAREEVIDKILSGETVGGVWLEDVLDNEIESNRPATLRCLAEDLSDIGAMGDMRLYERAERITKWLRNSIEFYLDCKNPQLVEDYAERLAEEDEPA